MKHTRKKPTNRTIFKKSNIKKNPFFRLLATNKNKPTKKKTVAENFIHTNNQKYNRKNSYNSPSPTKKKQSPFIFFLKDQILWGGGAGPGGGGGRFKCFVYFYGVLLQLNIKPHIHNSHISLIIFEKHFFSTITKKNRSNKIIIKP